MLRQLLVSSALLLCTSSLLAQTPEPATATPAKEEPARDAAAAAQVKLPPNFTARHKSTIAVKGRRIPYQVTVGTQPVWDEKGKAVASMFYMYYERTDVTDKSTRPLVISFNGGPGSASVWMHMAYTSPKMLRMDAEGYPIQPYGVQDNPHSIIDVADIVYVDTVNTGFSRIVGDAKREQFFGVNEDIAYLAGWIDTFVSRNGRWTSPKYLIGESYGTTRVAGLAQRLQEMSWMNLNGVILVSPTGLGVDRSGPTGEALQLPYFAAAAWYHHMLPADLQAKDLDQILPEVEAFAIDELMPALARGGSLDAARRSAIVKRVAYYSGLKEETIRQHGLIVSTGFFWKELLRGQGLTIGRLDSRYRGLDRQDSGEAPEFDPALASWTHAFAPAINQYLREELGVKTDLQYWLFGPVGPWSWQNDSTGANLEQAMATNPFLHLLVQSGYYDGGTPYFDAKYTMWNMDPLGRLQDRMSFRGYRSGHMMYLRQEDLARSNEDLRTFIAQSTPKPGQPAKR